MRNDLLERPAALALVSYSFGLAIAPVLVSSSVVAAGLVLVAMLLSFLRVGWTRRAVVFCLLATLGVLVGAHVAQREAREDALLASGSPDTFATVYLQLEDGWTPRPDGSWRLRARQFSVQGKDGSVRLFRERVYVLLWDSPPDIRESRRIVARGFLRRMDDGPYVLSVKSRKLVRCEGYASRFDPRYWNRFLAARLDEVGRVSERARAGGALTQALVLGRGGLLPRETIDLYQRGGTYHLLVFSGVQIAMMAALVRWVLLRLRFRRSADVALLLICAFMPRFVGSDPSVSRSALMIGLLLGAWLWKRPTDASNLVFVSALVRLVLVPGDLTDPGFALTYSATAGILVVGRALAKGKGRMGSAIAYGVGAELGTTPFTLFFFNRVTVGGSLVTLLVSPVLLAMLGIGFLATMLVGISPMATASLLEVVGLLNEPVMWINRFVAESAGLSIMAAAPSVFLLVASVAIAVTSASSGRTAGAILTASSLLIPVGSAVIRSLPADSAGEVHFLDVGQGDAILAVSQGRGMLVDGGGSRTNSSFGTRTLLPLLVERGVRHLDVVALSHPHPDHCSGLIAVLRDLKVDRFLVSKRHLATDCGRALTDVALRRNVSIEDAESVNLLTIGEIEVEVLTTSFRYRRSWENNSSLLFRLRSGSRRLLLTGDVERDAERVLSGPGDERLSAQVLKVAHHGSRTSTTDAFLNAVAPRIAVISCGERNRFGHPHEETVARLASRAIRTEATAWSGNLVLRFDGGPLSIERQFDSGRLPP